VSSSNKGKVSNWGMFLASLAYVGLEVLAAAILLVTGPLLLLAIVVLGPCWVTWRFVRELGDELRNKRKEAKP